MGRCKSCGEDFPEVGMLLLDVCADCYEGNVSDEREDDDDNHRGEDGCEP